MPELASLLAIMVLLTAQISSDAVAAIAGRLIYFCRRHSLEGVGEIYPTLRSGALASLWGNVRKGEPPGRRSILQAVPDGALPGEGEYAALGMTGGAANSVFSKAHPLGGECRGAGSRHIPCDPSRHGIGEPLLGWDLDAPHSLHMAVGK